MAYGEVSARSGKPENQLKMIYKWRRNVLELDSSSYFGFSKVGSSDAE
jgi:hypothetical protein